MNIVSLKAQQEANERARREWFETRRVKAKDAVDRGLNILEFAEELCVDAEYSIGRDPWESAFFMHYYMKK